MLSPRFYMAPLALAAASVEMLVGLGLFLFPGYAAPHAWIHLPVGHLGTAAGLFLGGVSLLAVTRYPPRARLWRLGVWLAAAPLFVVTVSSAIAGAWTGAVVCGLLAAAVALTPWPGTTSGRAGWHGDTGPESAAMLDRMLQGWIWGVSLLLMALTALSGPEALGTALGVKLVVLALCAYNLLAYWVLPDRGTPAQRVMCHLYVLTGVLGLLLVSPGEVGHGFLALLVALPPLAARSVGRRPALRLLGAALVVVSLSDLAGWLQGEPFPVMMGEMTLELVTVTIAALVGIVSGAAQLAQTNELAAARSGLQRQVDRLTLLTKISSAVHQVLNIDDVLQAIVADLAHAVNASRCIICTDGPDSPLRSVHQYAADGADGCKGCMHTPDRCVVMSEPLGGNGLHFGSISFCASGVAESWSDVERQFVHAVASQLSAALMHRRHLQELVDRNGALEEALAENTRLAAILETTPDFVGMADRSGRRIYINKAGQAMLGYPDRASALGDSLSRAHPPWARDLILNHAIPTAVREGYWMGESALRTLDGREIPVSQAIIAHRDPAGEVTCLSTITRDITRQKWMEEAVRESEAKYRTLIEKIQDGFFVMVDGVVNLVNPAMAAIVGTPMDEMIGRPLSDFIYPDDLPMVLDNYQRRIAGEAIATSYEFRLLHQRTKQPIFVSASTGVFTFHGQTATLGTIRDVTERKRMEAALRESEARYRLLVERSPNAIIVVRDGRVLFANDAAAAVYGAPRAEQLVGLRLDDAVHPDWLADTHRRLAALVSGHDNMPPHELRVFRLDGSPVDLEVTSTLTMFGGEPAIQVVGTDITERKEVEARLRHLAHYDSLTSLLNRRRFQEEVAARVAAAAEADQPGALLFLDLDQFKYVNDSLGHPTGDLLLQGIADVLHRAVRPGDIVSRLGGDEFAILLQGVDREGAERAAERLGAAVRQHTTSVDGHPVSISVSIGIALFPSQGETAAELLARADLAMYQAKENGRNGYAVYAPEMGHEQRMESKLTWERRIRAALEHGGLVLQAQPIRDLRTGTVSRYELLLRMRDDDGSLIPPAAFLDTAERFGLIQQIDRWVVHQAIGMLAELKRAGRQMILEVNLSGKSFTDPELLAQIRHELAATGVDPSHLVLEITETSAIANLDVAGQFVETLRQLGCRFALDDFGSGFSSFAYLKHLPIDFLKIDGGFVRNLAKSPVDQQLVKAMVAVAQGLGKQTVAEFVEDAETYTLLRELGVDFAQGYHIGRPADLAVLHA